MKEVFKKDGDTLELYEDMTQYNDSLLIESGTKICKFIRKDGKSAVIETQGEIKIFYYPNGDMGEESEGPFRYPSDYPDEIIKLIKNGEIYDSNKAYVDENNWFEITYYEDGEMLDSDVVEDDNICGNTASIENIFKICKDYTDWFFKTT